MEITKVEFYNYSFIILVGNKGEHKSAELIPFIFRRERKIK